MMPNIAILIGNTEYQSLSRLECCQADLAAMRELLEATEKFEHVEVIENATASELKDKIRAIVENVQSTNELFLYYSGHGYSHEEEFFYCATNFEKNRPFETGLSTTDLHTFLRLANADLVIKIVDACNSGTLLVKADIGLTAQTKQGFKNLIQISSCLEAQSSLTGDPLSLFTEKFRNSVLSKKEGIVYYTDVISALRDQFIGNDAQTPFFVSQYTGREQFADDSRKLDKIRGILAQQALVTVNFLVNPESSPKPPTLLELLSEAEANLVNPQLMGKFISTFFDDLKTELEKSDFVDFFQILSREHDDFQEPTTKRFIIETLSREKRIDNFVTAEISRKNRRNNRFALGMQSLISSLYDDEDYVAQYDLTLNCKMSRAQLCATLTPKFSALQRIVLVVTCAPSLENCYIFEMVTQHKKYDFDNYDIDGIKTIQRWYKFEWTESTNGVVQKIVDALVGLVRTQIENSAKRLGSS